MTPTQTDNSIPTPTRRMFDLDSAAKYLKKAGIDAATARVVLRLINRGELAHVRLCRKFYVSSESLDAWLTKAERKVRP